MIEIPKQEFQINGLKLKFDKKYFTSVGQNKTTFKYIGSELTSNGAIAEYAVKQQNQKNSGEKPTKRTTKWTNVLLYSQSSTLLKLPSNYQYATPIGRYYVVLILQSPRNVRKYYLYKNNIIK